MERWWGMSVKHSPYGALFWLRTCYVVLGCRVLEHSLWVHWEGSPTGRVCPLTCDGFSPCM